MHTLVHGFEGGFIFEGDYLLADLFRERVYLAGHFLFPVLVGRFPEVHITAIYFIVSTRYFILVMFFYKSYSVCQLLPKYTMHANILA